VCVLLELSDSWYAGIVTACEVCVHAKMWVVCSELAFVAKTVSVAANYHSLPKLSCLERNCDSLPKLCRLQRINIRCWIVCSAAKLWFAVENASSVANWHSLPNGVFCSDFVIRCRNWVSAAN